MPPHPPRPSAALARVAVLLLLPVQLAALLLALVALAQPLPVCAQAVPTAIASAIAASASPSSASTDTAPIATNSGARQDAQIANRLRAIFAALPTLRTVQVSVASGVVTLTGTVPNAAAIDQAGAIAGRLSGVVIVQNQLQRSLAVDNNLDPALSGMKAKLRGFIQMLPLIAVGLLVAFIVGAIGYVIARRRSFWERVAPNPFLAELMASAVRVVFVIGGLALGLQIVGATALLGAILGGAGVIGLALGLAVKDTVDNYVSSLMLSVRQPFRANDSVKIDSYEGTVVRMTTRATVLMTADGNHLRVPNSTVYKAVITNFTTNPHRRFNFDYAIDHGFDPCLARNEAMKALTALDFILSSPEPSAEVTDVSGANQMLRFHGWVDQTQTDFGKARTRAIEAVRSRLREIGAVLPEARTIVQIEQPDTASSAPDSPSGDKTMVDNDVDPQRHVENMVRQERSSDSDSGRDLLDSDRPTE